MKIVILDGYTENPGDLSWEAFRRFGEVTVYDRVEPSDDETVIRCIGDAQIVYTNKAKITKNVIDACKEIKYIGVLATGYDIVDVKYAREKGIPVTNVPTYGTASVSQFAIGLLLEICHHIGHHDRTVHEGKWESCKDWCYWDYPLIELSGKTMGIIGLGRIGQSTGRIAEAMGMKVLAYDAVQTESGREIAEYADLDTLLQSSDVIALHCPLFPDTREIIRKETIRKMKDGVMIINNSRGGLINEQDLADALNEGKVYAAAVDVVSSEPVRGDNPLLSAKNCIITPHMSWAAKEARQRIMDTAVSNLEGFLAGEEINVVNR